MTHAAVIVFALSVRVCGSVITDSCHWERIGDFTTEQICRTAGRIMDMYPTVFGHRCKIETREYQFRPGIGNPF